ncbi:DedA family protein [Eleftheria terrae]|uniref:DedA family protein n=1 Tax=Eleftheria terrae TaxID=1597781 RepID=UPI00263BA5F0|nr:DedA family protein [Eleftheria terrae]WKB51364.1 DedA family protein [Eleftheria terrae]
MLEWIIQVITEHGYLAVLLLMCAENLFPPLPSELIMPFAGFAAARGDLGLAGVVASGTLGSLLGALPWYLAGRRLGSERLRRLAERHGRWLAVSAEDLDRAEAWFQRHGAAVLVLGRMVPGVRTLVAVPAGLAALPCRAFLAWSLLGSLLWTSLLTAAGYLLESQFEAVAGWLDPVAKAVLAVLLLTYLVRVLRLRRRGAAGSNAGRG